MLKVDLLHTLLFVQCVISWAAAKNMFSLPSSVTGNSHLQACQYTLLVFENLAHAQGTCWNTLYEIFAGNAMTADWLADRQINNQGFFWTSFCLSLKGSPEVPSQLLCNQRPWHSGPVSTYNSLELNQNKKTAKKATNNGQLSLSSSPPPNCLVHSTRSKTNNKHSKSHLR